MATLPVSVVVAAFTVAVALPLLGWALLSRPGAAVVQTRENLLRGLEGPDAAGRGPAGPGPFVVLARGLTPAGTVSRINRLLGPAGYPAAWPLSKVIAAKLGLALFAAAFGLLLVLDKPSLPLAMIMAVFTVVCWFVPELLLYSRGQERQQAIGLELADTLDQMTIAVEAGLGFEAAMARSGKNGKGPLAEELVRTLQDIAVGQPRREAYLALAERTGVPDLRRFIAAVVQADQYGISVSDVLRTQAQEMRLKRRQRAEAKAMQIPVKVIFPLMLCILPALFIVLLGPTVLHMMAAFGH